MLIIEKGNKLQIVIDLFWAVICGVVAIICIRLLPILIFNTKWDKISNLIFAVVIIIIAGIVFSWNVYQLITKAISENFKIEFFNECFTIKSIFIKQTVRFDSIQSIYIVTRGLRQRKGSMELLKIRTKTRKKIYISLSILNKKEEKELRRIFKDGIGKKVREKYEFWE